MESLEIVRAEGAELVMRLPTAGCSQSTLYAATFELIDRAWVVLGEVDDAWTVTLIPREEDTDLTGLAAELGVELAQHALREQIRKDNHELLHKLRTESFGKAPGGGGDADWGTAEEDFGDLDDLDFLDDPLGIAVPWEEATEKKDDETKNDGDEPKEPDGS